MNFKGQLDYLSKAATYDKPLDTLEKEVQGEPVVLRLILSETETWASVVDFFSPVF